MTEYTMVCAMEHQPEELRVEAEDDDQAMQLMMAKLKEHNAEKHPEVEMTDEDMEGFIKSRWNK